MVRAQRNGTGDCGLLRSASADLSGLLGIVLICSDLRGTVAWEYIRLRLSSRRHVDYEAILHDVADSVLIPV